ncbi:MAG: hypothetical protein IJV17_02375 [Prevotella sp.]|nr:hypothetical protein [Prevotella sp.]MBQ9216274.1 hypothetical protein [Prevotella sp.]
MKRKILTFVCMAVVMMTSAQRVIRVEKNNAQSLIAAIEQANVMNADSTAERLFVMIPSGYYNLGEKVLTTLSGHNIALVGEGMLATIIRNAPDAAKEGISTTAVILNLGTNNYFQDMTLRNDLDYYSLNAAGRAVCLQDKGTRTILNRVRMLSYQDTYYTWAETALHYLQNCEIHGTVDFICGAGDVWFERCRIVTEKRNLEGKGRNVIAAPRTSQTDWGFVFNHCTIENIMSQFDYARGWHTHPRCTWLYTTLLSPEKLNQTRFDYRGMRTVQNDFKEYGTMDAAGNDITPKSNVVTFVLNDEKNPVETILTKKEARKYTVKRVFPDWRPDKLILQLEKQVSQL